MLCIHSVADRIVARRSGRKEALGAVDPRVGVNVAGLLIGDGEDEIITPRAIRAVILRDEVSYRVFTGCYVRPARINVALLLYISHDAILSNRQILCP